MFFKKSNQQVNHVDPPKKVNIRTVAVQNAHVLRKQLQIEGIHVSEDEAAFLALRVVSNLPNYGYDNFNMVRIMDERVKNIITELRNQTTP